MFTVALVGGDGAGKSTISRMLSKSFRLPTKYLYMGINVNSSNVSLPTSRLANFIVKKFKKTSHQFSNQTWKMPISKRNKSKTTSNLRAAVRIILFIAEESFRLIISRIYQQRGFIVVYDRYFTLDFESNPELPTDSQLLADRLHRWFLVRCYPRPDLVIFLDAPPEVLFERKGEGTLEYLKSRKQAFVKQGEQILNFIQVDATQSIDDVYNEVSQHILQFYEKRTGKKAGTVVAK